MNFGIASSLLDQLHCTCHFQYVPIPKERKVHITIKNDCIGKNVCFLDYLSPKHHFHDKLDIQNNADSPLKMILNLFRRDISLFSF
jgi:hypothetical protein